MGRVALFDYLLLRGLGEAVSGPSYVAVQESKDSTQNYKILCWRTHR